MPIPHPRRPRILGAGVLGLSLTLLTAACSGSSPSDQSAPPPTTAAVVTTTAEVAPTTTEAPIVTTTSAAQAEEVAAPASMIPSALVTNVATGEELDFASIAPADTPILLWMWAPH